MKPKKKAKKTRVPKKDQDLLMTSEQFSKALKKLGLTVAAQRTAEALGIGRRHVQRIASGDADVSPTLTLLVQMYLKHGIEHA
jgi:plasmid maintenance system antidote protein VapI